MITVDEYSWVDPYDGIVIGLDPNSSLRLRILDSNDPDSDGTDIWTVPPGSGTINVAPILNPYLNFKDMLSKVAYQTNINNWPVFTAPVGSTTISYQPLYFCMLKDDGSIQNDRIWTVLYDYSFTKNLNTLINDPVDSRIYEGQYLFRSYRNYGDTTVSQFEKNGRQLIYPASAISFFKLYVDADHYGDGDWSYTFVPAEKACGVWVLYYVNHYGGIDSYGFRGNIQQSYNKSTSYITNQYRSFASLGVPVRDKDAYMTKIGTTVTLNSGPLNDEDAGRFNLIFQSPMVWIQPLGTDMSIPIGVQEINPCTINQNSIQMKSYINNGRAVPSYELTVTIPDKIIR